jgi:two-component system, OmpR family, KDP operon response regulator KdpE
MVEEGDTAASRPATRRDVLMATSEPDHSRGEAARPPSSVLVVDDEKAILMTMAINLRARGYDVHVASNGSQALAFAARRHPDVIVLDLGLPDMDGVDVIRGLRGWTSVPIIVLSARTAEA